jgi:hypothetical protein
LFLRQFVHIAFFIYISSFSQAFNKVARRDEGTDDDVRPWLAGFVQDKGSVAAEALLAGVGHLEPKATSSDNLEGI